MPLRSKEVLKDRSKRPTKNDWKVSKTAVWKVQLDSVKNDERQVKVVAKVILMLVYYKMMNVCTNLGQLEPICKISYPPWLNLKPIRNISTLLQKIVIYTNDNSNYNYCYLEQILIQINIYDLIYS